MTHTHISRDLDRLGLEVMPFQALAHVARCADRSGAACVLLSGMAATCGMLECRILHDHAASYAVISNRSLTAERELNTVKQSDRT